MPTSRRAWGLAMRAELEHLSDPWLMMAFALGCVRAAATQRLTDGPTRYRSGRFAVVAAALACATFHLGCVVTGIGVLQGTRADPVVSDLIRRTGTAELAAIYEHLRPMMILLVAALGGAHLMMAWQACRSRYHAFAITWAIAAATAVALVACIVLLARSTEGAVIQLSGLVVQALAMLCLIGPNSPGSANGSGESFR